MKPKFYTSRSSIESYRKCPRYRYLHDYYQGTGIVPSAKSVPLTSGTCVHEGVGYLLKRMMITGGMIDERDIDNAVLLAITQYMDEVEKSGLYGKGVTLPHQQQYTFDEQKALTEALIRVWAMVEAPQIYQRFVVVGVEKEIEVPLPNSDVILQVRVDAELQDRKDSSFYNYSLKTAKQWGEREEKSYRRDLQGITEMYGVEQHYKVVNESIDSIYSNLGDLFLVERNPKLLDIQTYLLKRKQPPKKVMGVKFCFLIKGYFGPKEKGVEDGVYLTHSPLIRGYRNIGPQGVTYAHSLYYPNSSNQSGWGRLGKGWEQFDVWTDEGWGIKKWVETIALGENGPIQPECGDVVGRSCVTPVEYFRDEREIEEEIESIRYQEIEIQQGMDIPYTVEDTSNYFKWMMSELFPKHRNSCHYPVDCEYNPICWPGMVGANGNVSDDPVGSGLFQVRVPHHRGEMEQIERIRKEKVGK